MGQFNPEHERILDSLMAGNASTTPGKMFGYPGYKVNGKLAVGLHEHGIIAKVGRNRAQELIGQANVTTFEPQPGRVWRDWVLLTGDFESRKPLFEEAVAYVMKETSA